MVFLTKKVRTQPAKTTQEFRTQTASSVFTSYYTGDDVVFLETL